MVSFGFIKPPQKEMVHIPKSSSENTDIAEKEGWNGSISVYSTYMWSCINTGHMDYPELKNNRCSSETFQHLFLMLRNNAAAICEARFNLMFASEDRVHNSFLHSWSARPVPFNFKSINRHTYTPPMYNLCLYLGQLQAELQWIFHPLEDSKSCYVSVWRSRPVLLWQVRLQRRLDWKEMRSSSLLFAVCGSQSEEVSGNLQPALLWQR